MSDYIVTARKWRPMKFDDVEGQDHVTVTLRNAIAAQRVAHAYLFSGPRGVGKTTTARLLAKAVNCLHPKDNNPCNECENCVEITEGRCFDVLEIDGASNRGVDEIRNLRESVRYAPTKGKYRTYIIDEVHMLTKEAFNALLKTLEEPPPHVLFIFATTEIHKVPATILSRCQRFDFRRIATEEIASNLRMIAKAEKLTIDEEALFLIARKGDGSMRDAQSMFDQVVALCGATITHAQILEALNIVDQEMYFRVTDLIRARDASGALALVDDIMKRGYDLKEFLSGLGEHLRNFLVVRSTGSATLVEASDVQRARYSKDAGAFTVNELLRYQKAVGATEAALRFSIQPRFRLEADLVQLVTMPGARDVGELLNDLDTLKKKLSVERFDGAPVVPVRRVSEPAPAAHHAPPAPVIASPRVERPAVAEKSVLSENEFASRWKEFIDEVRRQKISLGSIMESTGFLGVRGTTVRVGCTNDFQLSSVTRNKEFLSGIIHAIFNVYARVEGEMVTDSGHDGNGKQDEALSDDHPIIAAMKRELGAEPI